MTLLYIKKKKKKKSKIKLLYIVFAVLSAIRLSFGSKVQGYL